MTQLDGYTVQYASPPGPPTIGISYSVGALSRLGSSPSLKTLKRKRSDSMMVAGVTISVPSDPSRPPPIILPDIHHDSDEPYVEPPSPVPTEIYEEPVEETPEERMEAAKATGVKVRDFAYEPIPKSAGEPRAPEVWIRCMEQLILHDRYIRAHPTCCEPLRLSGKNLHNLLAIGWVTRKEASENWREADWKAVNEYTSRPNGPYPVCIPKSFKKPTAAYRAALRLESFPPKEDDVPEDCIYVPPDEPGMDDGPLRLRHAPLVAQPTLPYEPTPPASPSCRRNATQKAPVDDVHVDKRRRVSGGATPPATPPAGPSHALSRTLSRSASFQTLSRSGTPPCDESKAAPRRNRGLQRTQTMASIPVR
ncbi:hypothetical protein C8Q80DRAFT_1144020 [Daedaleopsis nitida]|nr:hypothetical protein C8Q80DRAFT_1144020 [Daedaleopsis nitida]